ncbi:TonB-dependent receptor [Ferrimonas aestuarii]|uniref:Iron complex outermembrane recepter protein n=1 Tax=Ferrimonas aestuarii TaxID=2569539 RepID=A0A4U1BR22_9GAMM|nr:TonB-dependent receptor [Ferrimonas aestuarii]TKB55461.1 hypothetical protein FCL42_09750 [Ferrimonas aestuarii]
MNSRWGDWKLSLTATWVAAALASPAQVSAAQEALGEYGELEVITITADKIERDKQDVASSVSVFEGYTLEDMGVDSLEGIANRTPNVSFYRADSHTTYLVYRGIGGTTNMNKVWNVNVDDVTLPYVATDILLDAARVEVLRGSQGALYGRNTHAGVVNVVTRSPDDYFDANGVVSYESYNTMKFTGAVGGPIDDDMGYRFALGYRSGDGYFKNRTLGTDDGNDHQQVSARGKFVYAPTDIDKLTFSLTLDRFDGGFDSYAIGGGTTTESNEPGYNDGSLVAPSVTWVRQLSLGKLTSITAYSDSNYGFLQDWDFTAMDIMAAEYDENFQTFTQEFRLEGQSADDLNWLVGAFLLVEDLDTETMVRFGADAGAAGMPADFEMSQRSTIKSRGGALFGQVVYQPWQAVELTGRLRLDYERKELDWQGFAGPAPTGSKSFDEGWFAALPSVSAAWILSDEQRIYGSISRGYKAGDFNNVQVDPAVVTEPVDPEYATTYELGYKGTLADRRLELNAALFYVDWQDLQVETQLNVPGAAPVFLKQNAAEAHSSGIEVELRAQPHEDWELFAGGSYLFDYEFDKYPNSVSGDISGNLLPNANEFVLNGGAVYRHDSGLFFAVDATVNGSRFFDEANQFEQKTYTLVNARIGYEGESMSAYLYGRNLLDEDYALSMFNGTTMSAEPAIVGVQVKVEL